MPAGGYVFRTVGKSFPIVCNTVSRVKAPASSEAPRWSTC
jgi:hypothetical protein